MLLKDWIDTLAALPPEMPLRMANGNLPVELRSWRGDYAQLTLDNDTPDDFARWGSACDPPRPRPEPTVGLLLADARAAVGKTFEGYKGGDFTMDLDKAVWADPWGDYHCNLITGVRVTGGVAIVTTMEHRSW